MGKVLCFIYPNMAEFEVMFAFHRLLTVGNKEIITIGSDRNPLVSQSGFIYTAAATIEDAFDYPDVEALLIPGGPITEQPPQLTQLIQQLDRERKLLAAICNGPQFLGRAGILDRHSFTTSCSPASIASLGVSDPFPRDQFLQQRVVRDGHVITATGRAFVDFSFAVFDWLNIFDSKEELQALYEDIRGPIS
ncbi:thiamine biosynthesis protein ThiJ [Paenibacillus sp. LMG 31456]|uniref:Thiamine biosynthesis protein ThiJ n=1 Tax=Paenibacillus foliorum TaxID=2654974 RepID=A0A972JYV5_9BACL|nr:DJ-1/PfpI family protein [Paenibacillus foliorum]NOU92095.1 thiamine biosynthesis protein ThiJ [Paenibacillus foliorum]